jgi:hypothetical protein
MTGVPTFKIMEVLELMYLKKDVVTRRKIMMFKHYYKL